MFAAEVLARGTLLLLLAFGALHLLRGLSAAARHWLWTVAMLGLLALPLVTAFVPALSLPVIPGRWRVALASPSALESGRAAADAAATALSSAPAVPPVSAAFPPEGLLRLLTWVWALGSLFFVVRLIVEWWIARRVMRRAERVPASEWLGPRSVSDASFAAGVELAVSDDIPVPATAGFRHLVLVPRRSFAWPRRQREAALRHELAHVGRRDYAVHVVGQLARALHWPNPLAWAAERCLLLEREIACDDEVIRSGVDPLCYAESLIALARTTLVGPAPRAGAVSFLGRNEMRVRLARITGPVTNRRPVSTRVRLACAGVVAVLVPLLGAATPVERRPEPVLAPPAAAGARAEPLPPAGEFGQVMGSWRLPVGADAILRSEGTPVDIVFRESGVREARVELHVAGGDARGRAALVERLDFGVRVLGRDARRRFPTVTFASNTLSPEWDGYRLTALVQFPSGKAPGHRSAGATAAGTAGSDSSLAPAGWAGPRSDLAAAAERGHRVRRWEKPLAADLVVDAGSTEAEVIVRRSGAGPSRIELWVDGVTPAERAELLDDLGLYLVSRGRDPVRHLRLASDPLGPAWAGAAITLLVYTP